MSTTLFPQLDPGQRLVGIAKLAAAGEAVDEGHNVEYITLETIASVGFAPVAYQVRNPRIGVV